MDHIGLLCPEGSKYQIIIYSPKTCTTITSTLLGTWTIRVMLQTVGRLVARACG